MAGAKIIHISWANVFMFKGVTIGWHNYLGPTILNRHTGNDKNYKNISWRVWGDNHITNNKKIYLCW